MSRIVCIAPVLLAAFFALGAHAAPKSVSGAGLSCSDLARYALLGRPPHELTAHALVPGTDFRPRVAPVPNGIVNPPPWNLTNSMTNTVPVYITEPSGGLLFYTARVVFAVYAYTNDPAAAAEWFDLWIYPGGGINIVDRKGRSIVQNAMPQDAGDCYFVNDFNGKLMLAIKRDGENFSLLLYRVTRRGLKLLGEHPTDTVALLGGAFGGGGSRILGAKVVDLSQAIDFSSRTYTSGLVLLNRRLSKTSWSRSPATGVFVPVDVDGRGSPVFRNGVACLFNLFGSPYSWTVSKRGKTLYTHAPSIPTNAYFDFAFDDRGRVIYWVNTGTMSTPTNSPLTLVDRKGAQPLDVPDLGGVGWELAEYDGKYFLTSTASGPHILSAYALRGRKGLRAERSIADYDGVTLAGARAYVFTRNGVYQGVNVYTADLHKEKWQVPMSAGELQYIGRGVIVRQVLNTNTTPLEITLTYFTRKGVRAEHVMKVDSLPVAAAAAHAAPPTAVLTRRELRSWLHAR
jgi:hypothetical protein